MSTPPPPPPDLSPEALARARDRLASVGAMAALIGHKARNRLASFRAVLEVLQQGWEKNLSAEHRAAVLQQFEAFVGDFNFGVDMVRCDFGRPESIEIPAFVADALAYLEARDPAVRVHCVVEPGLKPVSTDRPLLRLVLLNLLRNAADAVAGQAAAAVTVRVTAGVGILRCEVADNGPGVAPRIRDQIFVTPCSTREDGVGLGLLLCRDAMTVLGGTVVLASGPGDLGACFRIELPAR